MRGSRRGHRPAVDRPSRRGGFAECGAHPFCPSPERIQRDIHLPVRWIDEVLETALATLPTPLSDEGENVADVKPDETSASDENTGVRAH